MRRPATVYQFLAKPSVDRCQLQSVPKLIRTLTPKHCQTEEESSVRQRGFSTRASLNYTRVAHAEASHSRGLNQSVRLGQYADYPHLLDTGLEGKICRDFGEDLRQLLALNLQISSIQRTYGGNCKILRQLRLSKSRRLARTKSRTMMV